MQDLATQMAEQAELLAYEARMMNLAREISQIDPQKLKRLVEYLQSGSELRRILLPPASLGVKASEKILASLALLAFAAHELSLTVPTAAELADGAKEMAARLPDGVRTLVETAIAETEARSAR